MSGNIRREILGKVIIIKDVIFVNVISGEVAFKIVIDGEKLRSFQFDISCSEKDRK